MIQPALRTDMERELAEILKDITKTVEENRAALRKMADGLFDMFNPERDTYSRKNVPTFYILRAAVYQKNGYSYISSALKEKLWEQFLEKDPKAVIKTKLEIRDATGLMLPDKVVSRAMEKRVKERVDRWTVRNTILDHTNKLLEELVGER